MLAKTAGVKHLVVLINKMDDPTVDWSVARYASRVFHLLSVTIDMRSVRPS